MTRLLLIFSQSGYLIQIVGLNVHSWWQTVQIQISWLLHLDLHCLQKRVYPGSAGQGLKAPEHRGTSNEYSQCMLSWKNKKILICYGIALDKALFSAKKNLYFSYFSTKTYLVGTHQKPLGESISLGEALLMSTLNICFCWERRKLFSWYPLLSRPMLLALI